MNTDFDFFPHSRPNFNFKKSTRSRDLKFWVLDSWDRLPDVVRAVLFGQLLVTCAFFMTYAIFSTPYFKALGDVPIYESNDYKASQRMVEVLTSEVAKAPSRIPHETLDAMMNDAEVKKAMAAAFLKQADKPNKPILLETEQTP